MLENKEKTYFHNLDLLRIVSMFMIVLTHILGKGGLRDAVDGREDAYFFIVWIMQIFAYVAVNCYGLISGYIGLGSESKLSKIALLWLQVLFYTLVITVCSTSLVISWMGMIGWAPSFRLSRVNIGM